MQSIFERDRGTWMMGSQLLSAWLGSPPFKSHGNDIGKGDNPTWGAYHLLSEMIPPSMGYRSNPETHQQGAMNLQDSVSTS